jgi:uncharacterized membrane protein YqhA
MIEGLLERFLSSSRWPFYLGLVVMLPILLLKALQELGHLMSLNTISDRDLTWHVVFHLVFVGSGLVLALTDRVSEGGHRPIAKSAAAG